MKNARRESLIALVVLGALVVDCPGCNDDSSANRSRRRVAPTAQDKRALLADAESTQRNISDAVDEFFRAIDAGEIDDLYEASAPAFRQSASREKFNDICDRVRTRIGELESKELSRLDLSPSGPRLLASATYRAQFARDEGTVFVVFEKDATTWRLLRVNINTPKLLDAPTEFRERMELFVVDSEPVLPGALVDLVDSGAESAVAVLENARVVSVRWKTPNRSTAPTFPASGFVTLDLTKDQIQAVRAAASVSLRRHEDDKGGATRGS